MALVLDTGPLFAAYDRRDADHVTCSGLLASFPESFIVPAPVLVELDYWLGRYGRELGRKAFWQDLLDGAFEVVGLEADDYTRCVELMERYADSDIGFVDAAVLSIVERLREPKLATLDHRHFRLLRPRHVDALDLLPG